jgi:hypothetical protein
MPLHHVKSHYDLILYYTSTYVERVVVSQHDNTCSFISIYFFLGWNYLSLGIEPLFELSIFTAVDKVKDRILYNKVWKDNWTYWDTCQYYILYNNAHSNAIVNAASDITYRPVIEAAVLNIWTLTFYCFRLKNMLNIFWDFRVSNHCWAFQVYFDFQNFHLITRLRWPHYYTL